MSFLDKLFTSGIAKEIATPTTTIDVSSSEPALNKTLKVTSTSPLRATWESAGGGPKTASVLGVADATVAAALDTQYLVGASGITLTLPDFALADCGRSVVIITSSASIVLTAPPSGAISLGQNEPPTTAAAGGAITLAAGGVFVLRCFFSVDLPQPYYLVEGRRIPTRSEQDVTVTVLSVPSDAVVTTNGDGTITLSANPSGITRLVYDADTQDLSNFNPAAVSGQGYTCVFPWGGNTGKGTIIRDLSATDWQIDGIPSDVQSTGLLGSSKAQFTPLHGLVYKGRSWETNETTTGLLRLLRQPLDIYPRSGEDALLGDTSTTFRGLKHNQILIGKTNRIDGHAAEGPTYTLLVGAIQQTSDLEARMGERFSLVNESSVSYVAQVIVSSDWMSLVGPDGVTSATLNLTMDPGTYIEWQLCPGGIWRCVAYITSTPPAASLVTNDSGVAGATVKDALDTLSASLATSISSAQALTPYIVAPATPNAFDDEFNSGSPDLATRGYTVLNGSTTMTRGGDIGPWNATGPAGNTYWSTLIGSWLFVQAAPGVELDIAKTISLSAGDTYFCRTVGTYNLQAAAPGRFNEVGLYGFSAGALDNNNRVYSTVRDDPASSWLAYDVARLTAGVAGGPIGKSGYGARDIRGIRYDTGTNHNAFLMDGQTGEIRSVQLTGCPSAASLVRFGIRNSFSSGGTGVAQVWGIDFIRKKTSNAWLIP
jgi:hypothetical protein